METDKVQWIVYLF